MSYPKLIHEYLDGQLDSTAEDVLFRELSGNSEIRAEFNQQVKLQSIAQADMGHIAPPLECTNKIFSTLGFALPAAETAPLPMASPSGSSALISFLKKYSTTAVTALVSSIITVLLLNLYLDKDTSANSEYAQVQYPVISSQSADNTSKSFGLFSEDASADNALNSITQKHNNDLLTSNSNDLINANNKNLINANKNDFINVNNKNLISGNNNNPNSPIAHNSGNVNTYATAQETDYEENYTSELISESINQTGIKKNRFNVRFPEASYAGTELPATGLISLDLETIIQGNSDYIVEGKYISGLLTPASDVSSSASGADNIYISALYKIDGNSSLGAEFGQEAFTQNFDRLNKGISINYSQIPTLFNVGVVYKYSAKNSLTAYEDVLYPFARAFAGVAFENQNFGLVGPIFKLQLGYQWQINSIMSFYTGAELNSLLYNVDNSIFHTEKLNLSSGFSINF